MRPIAVGLNDARMSITMSAKAINIKALFLIYIALSCILHAQTKNWRLVWDKNPAADSVAYYVVYRGTGSIPTSGDSIGLSTEPADPGEMTVVFNDYNLETGRQYYYRVQAIDHSLRRSALSVPVNKSIPKILLPTHLILQTGTTTRFVLNSEQVVSWPGYDNKDLQWKISGGTKIVAQLNPADNLLTFQTPADSTITENFSLSVENPDGFGDTKAISITLSVTAPPPPASEEMVFSVNHKIHGSSIAVINWQTRDDTRDYIQYGKNNLFTEVTPVEKDYGLVHQRTLSELVSETEYQYKIISESVSGTLYTSEVYSFVAGEQAEINVFPIPYNMNNPPAYGGVYFDIPSTGEPVTLQIYTAVGDLVYRISDLRQSYIWNIQNNAGREVNAGLYLYQITGRDENKIASGKLVIIH